LTNALRHARASSVHIGIRYEPARLELSVTDDGTGLDGAARQDGSAGGHGLVGIRERVALYDGTVDLTAGPTGGTRLVARLPVAGPA
jgi:signal transduction histidine kinase